MLTRRSFLISAGTIALSQGLTACSDREAALKVLLLKGSIPPQLIGAFYRQISSGKTLSFKPEAQLKDIFSLLQTWPQKSQVKETWQEKLPFIDKQTKIPANLVTLGDYWLEKAIVAKLIQPLNISDLTRWQQLSSRWQTLVKRNEQGQPDEKGQIWGAPYRWGSTLIAYRQDKFKELGWTPTDWQDLWREELRDRISLLDQPREVIGLTLKKLGHSYNSEDLSQISNLQSQLIALQKQVKFYSSDRYLEPLIVGDTWLAVGWSRDILALASRRHNIKAVIPRSGTALWADVWVKPASSEEKGDRSSILKQWIDFCWQARSASQISLFTYAASPIIASLKADELPKNLQKNPLMLVDPQIFDKCEFLYPLPPKTQKQYEELWQKLVTGEW
jgi:putative spermidine/putrescine transport system substrate-binding protein